MSFGDVVLFLDGTYAVKNDSLFLIVGVNHYETNKTLYDNVVLYKNEKTHMVPGPDVTNFEYEDSALVLNVSTRVSEEDLKKLFVVQTTLEQNCLKGLPGFCLTTAEAKDSVFVFTARNYLNPETKTRPDANETIAAVVLQFQVGHTE